MRNSSSMRRRGWIVPVVVFGSLLLPARSQEARRFDPSIERMRLIAVRNGFGQLLPHRVAVPDDQGLPTAEIVEIERQDDLANVRPGNPILPSAAWPSAAVLPDNLGGNHYLYARFSRAIDVDSVLTSAVSAVPDDNLLGILRVVGVDPLLGTLTPVRGRAFIGGKTYGAIDPADPTRLHLQRWVVLDASGRPRALPIAGARPGLGFPGTQSPASYPGVRTLLDDDTRVFVADSDGDLSTHEAFPSGVQIQLRIDPGVRSRLGDVFTGSGVASSTVGADTLSPEVLGAATPAPAIDPPDGTIGVDPATHVFVTFTEPVQPLSIGVLEGSGPAALSAALQLEFGPAAARVSVPFHARFPSLLDLTHVELVPAYAFPGSGGEPSCGSFGLVDVEVNPAQLADLAGNQNAIALTSSFATAQDPALVNAPVTPDAIYVARGGALSVIDLNGFGQSTGDPSYDFRHPIVKGNSNFPNNPNVALQGSVLTPPLVPGTCTWGLVGRVHAHARQRTSPTS